MKKQLVLMLMLFLLTACSSTQTVFRDEADSIHLNRLPKDGIEFSYDGRTISVPQGAFRDYGNFKRAEHTSDGRTDIFIVGGEKLGLEFSDFGLWASTKRAGLFGGVEEEFIAFTADDKGRNKETISSFDLGSHTFTGTTVAVASGGGEAPEIIRGSAVLKVDFGLLFDSSSLNLSFPDFARFIIPVIVGSGGGISAEGSVRVTDVDADRFIYGIDHATVSGQLYGNSSFDPSEAVGSYLLQGGFSKVQGSFGVKR